MSQEDAKETGKSYTVWIQIEEYDEVLDTYEEINILDFAGTASFDTLEEAEAFAKRLHELGEGLG